MNYKKIFGELPRNWTVGTLDQYAEVIDPHPSHRAPSEVSDGYPFLGIGDLDYYGNATFDKARHVGLEIIEEHEHNYKITETSIGYAKMGNTIGKVVSFPSRQGKTRFAVSPALSVINPNDQINPYYLRAVVESNAFWGQVNGKITGSTRPSIGIQQLRKILIPLPPDAIQERIGEIWKAIYDKISVNTNINDNLADLLQTVYQEHFGDVISAADQGILSDICSFSKDKVAVSKLDVSTYFSTENMLPGKFGATEATSLPTTPQTTACHEGDTLISNIRPYFKKIVYCEGECGCSTDVLCFTPAQPRYAAYLFSTLYADKFFAFMVAGSKGTKMPRGDKQQIMTYPVALPSDEELEEFNALAFHILMQIHSNRGENKRLSAVRDALLPKLMSGELDVSEVNF